MTRYLKELKPASIFDIMAMVALFRPGPMDSIPSYIQRKNNADLVDYEDPRMKEYLDQSLGLIVYQDDVLLTAINLAGYNWEEADKFRKAMGKKIPEEMAKQKEQFYKGCLEIGKVKKDVVDEIWHAIEPFAAYGFNKAHAASYGIVAYQTAYMKAHYPVQFMTAILQAEASDLDKVAAIVHECKRMGIEVLPPDVNESFKSFAMVSQPHEQGRIRFGLNAIKNVGEHICEVIYRERKENGTYTSLENFLERVQDKDLNKKSLESLAQAGALDCFGYDRNVLLVNSENILFFHKQARDRELTKQDSLFAASGINLDTKVTLKPAPNATMEQKLTWEKDLLGLYLSSHPLHPFVDVFKNTITQLSDIEFAPRDGWVVCYGVVESVKKKITKKGDVMLFVVIQDLSATMELLVFPKTYARTKDLWVERMPVCIVGKTPREDGDNKIFVENAYELKRETAPDLARQLSLSTGQKMVKENQAPEKYVRISLTTEELQDFAEPIKQILSQFPGDAAVYLQVGTGTVKAGTKVQASEDILIALERIIGEGRVFVSDN
jgi:DNA polymerase-3 subunit alpha